MRVGHVAVPLGAGGHGSVPRWIIGFGVHAGTLNGAALCRIFNRAILGQLWMPKYHSSDNDPLYRFHRWQANLRILEATEIKSIPYVPLSHPFVERLVGTIRREYPGSHLILDDGRSRKQTARSQDLLQQPSHAQLTGRANAGYARVTTNLQSPLVSMAATLSSPLSDTGGCLTKSRAGCGILSTLARHPKKSFGVCVLNRSVFRGSDCFTTTERVPKVRLDQIVHRRIVALVMGEITIRHRQAY